MSTPPPAPRPGWYRLAWFLGQPPPLSRRQWSVLGLVAIVSLFEQYDLYLFSLNLRHIQADLGIAEGDLGFVASLIRAGALPALLLTIAADRFGRRRMLLITVVGYTLLTGATAFAPNVEYFVVVQFLARTFAIAETLIAIVVIAEEFAPEHRGWGIGALGAIQATGAGLAALMFGFVDVLPGGWRALYLIGLGPLVLVAYWRRTLPETDRFRALAAARAEELRPTPAWHSLRGLLRAYPGRLAILALVVSVFGLASSSASFFAPKFLQDVYGWSPGWIAALNFGGGAFAIIANPLAGRLSDRFGRKPVTAAFVAGFACSAIGFYTLSVGPAIGLFWVVLIFTLMGSGVTLSAYGVELFPTSMRSTASGARSAISEVGAVAGLALVSTLFGVTGSNWSSLAVLATFALAAPLLVLLLFPETAGRSLDEISPEPEPEAAALGSDSAA